jgi:aminoglycoside phosphotransferase (APT) family kinase protein
MFGSDCGGVWSSRVGSSRAAGRRTHLDRECEWLVTNGVLPSDLVTRNRRISEAALRPWTPVFTHGDLQIAHVFVDRDEVTGVIDWSEAGQGDALYDLAMRPPCARTISREGRDLKKQI